MQSGQEKDPRIASLRFMYSNPKPNDMASSKEGEIDRNGDDEMVRKFRQKLIQKRFGSLQPYENEHLVELPPTGGSEHLRNHFNSVQTSLERQVGKRKHHVLSHEEQIERHPQLKNAPVEGGVGLTTSVQHKPFNAVIKDVRCTRCGVWGHRSGDRECVLINYNPLDYDRMRREDPMFNYTQQRSDYHEMLSHLLESEEEMDRVLSTLSSKEKKVLLNKLEQYQYLNAKQDTEEVEVIDQTLVDLILGKNKEKVSHSKSSHLKEDSRKRHNSRRNDKNPSHKKERKDDKHKAKSKKAAVLSKGIDGSGDDSIINHKKSKHERIQREDTLRGNIT